MEPLEEEAAPRAARRRGDRVRGVRRAPRDGRTSDARSQVRAEVLEHVTVTMLAEGHILVEDYPGVGKTALARALSRSIDCQFARVQCTADLLPADIVGTQIYNQREARFEFRPGPDLRQRRARRRGQPRVAEDAVGPARVHAGTPRHRRRHVARAGAAVPVVFATQNPVEYEGTYPLPEAQVDRFMVRLSLGYPSAEAEAGMLAGHESRRPRARPRARRHPRRDRRGGRDRAPRARVQGAARVHRRAAAPHARGRPRRARRLARARA